MLSRALLNSHQRPGPPRDAQFSSMERQSYRGLSISNINLKHNKVLFVSYCCRLAGLHPNVIHMGMEKELGSY